jgi:hypothetical protein
MKPNPLWRVFLVLALVTLACTFTSDNNFLPPTETPRPAPTDEPIDEDENQDQDQQDDEDQDQGDEDVDLDQDLDLGGLGDQDEDQDQDQQDQDEQDQDEQDQDEQDQDQGDECSPFRASSGVFWVTLDENYEIQEQVSSYPGGTTLITPVFEYDCVPTGVDIVSVFSYDGEVVYSDEESIQPSTSSGIYGYPLGTTDNSALGDGEWGIEFYVADELIGDGTVEVGGGNGQGQDGNELVAVEGSVVSASSGQPIDGALVFILVPGVTVQEWVDADYPDSDVYTGAETNSRGEFTLADPMERNTEYSVVVVAEGFQPLTVDGFVIGDDLEAPVFLEIELAE